MVKILTNIRILLKNNSNTIINRYFTTKNNCINFVVMSIAIKIILNSELYLKDPQESELGRKIIQHSILLMNDLGFESFTFKKLAIAISSTEASVYRYFENKHLLLTYLVSWYWEWVNYLIETNSRNIEDPNERLSIIIKSFVYASMENPSVTFVNESKLHEVVIAEGSKVYHTKEVDDENSRGFFKNYKDLIEKVSKVILQINPNFKYPHALATNLFEMSNNHIYFANHLPRLTDIKQKDNVFEEVERMLQYFAQKLLAE